MNRHGHVHTSCVGKFLYQGHIEHECKDRQHLFIMYMRCLPVVHVESAKWPSQCCMSRISDDCGKGWLVRDMIQTF